MTNTEHTPGPWQVEGVPKGRRPWVGRIAEGRWAALACGYTDEEAEANARLIAAAPDLLASLERLVTLMNIVGDEPFRNGVTDSTGSMDEGIVIASKWLHEARAAIAKATERVN